MNDKTKSYICAWLKKADSDLKNAPPNKTMEKQKCHVQKY